MEELSTFFNDFLSENPILGILLIIFFITLAFRFVLWLYDKLMGDKGFLGDVMNIIVWIIRIAIKILIVLIIASALFVTLF